MIGQIMKSRRAELGKKPSQVASIIGVSESTYRDWENGRKIQGEPYIKIAQALEMNILKLLDIEKAEHIYIREQLEQIENIVKNIQKIVI